MDDRPASDLRLIVAITGASGAIYAARLLKACLELGLTIDLVVSTTGRQLLMEECGLDLDQLESWLDQTHGVAIAPGQLTLHDPQNLGAPIASGSQHRDGMVVAPCSMKTVSGIAQGFSTNLIMRAADVTLKERRPLVLVPRETPLNLIQLENMTRAVRAGAILLPAMPAFYFKPRGIDDLADFIVGRIFSAFGIPHQLFKPWEG
jgi:4-hydroxy-3-polyprenylbenzoate decarboxylase